MTDNGTVTMPAVFHHGPADGGELVLNEPVPGVIAFPMTHVRAAALLADGAGGPWLFATPPGCYRLALTADGQVIRDTRRRIVYRYLPAVTTVTPANPTEGDTPDD